ncbi:hypothetical protein SDC9_207785 [bioreactor metagenome]|uniref:Uncharacterized protein n=1 Tax=bioreactor metagenome TaxID=1076179 RepID=A0A645JAC0_9ZZZZ
MVDQGVDASVMMKIGMGRLAVDLGEHRLGQPDRDADPVREGHTRLLVHKKAYVTGAVFQKLFSDFLRVGQANSPFTLVGFAQV